MVYLTSINYKWLQSVDQLFVKAILVMYIMYSMIRHYVLIKVFSFNSGVMLSPSFSDALLLENVIVIRQNVRARLVSRLGPTSQKQRFVG